MKSKVPVSFSAAAEQPDVDPAEVLPAASQVVGGTRMDNWPDKAIFFV